MESLYIFTHTQLQQKLKGIDLFTVHKILFTLSQFTVDWSIVFLIIFTLILKLLFYVI
jgi:hypothetical protein